MKFTKLLRTPNLRSADDCFWNLFFTWTALLITYTSGSNQYICFNLCIIIYSFVCQYSLQYYWYCYNQKQLSGAVLQKRCSYKFRKIHKKTSKKRFRHRCFLMNSAKFLIASFLKNPSDGCFTITTRSIYCPTTTFHLSKTMSHIFSGWVYFPLNL